MNGRNSGGNHSLSFFGKLFATVAGLALAAGLFACGGGGGGGGGGGQAPPPEDPAQQLSSLNQELRSELAQQIIQLEQEEGISLDEGSFAGYASGNTLAMMVPAGSAQSLSQAGDQNRVFLGAFFLSPPSGERVIYLDRSGHEARRVNITGPTWLGVYLLADQSLVEFDPLRGEPTDAQTGQPVTGPFTVPAEVLPILRDPDDTDPTKTPIVACITDEGCDPAGITEIKGERAVNAFVEIVLPGSSPPSVVKFKAGSELASVANGGGPGSDPTANILKAKHGDAMGAIRNFKRSDEADFDNPFPEPDLDNLLLYSGKNLFMVAAPFGGNVNLGERRGADLGLLYLAPSGNSQQFPAGLKGLDGEVYIVRAEFSEDGQQAWGYLVDKNGRQVSPSRSASLLELVGNTAGLSGKGLAQGIGPILSGPLFTPNLRLCYRIIILGQPVIICLDFPPPPQLPCIDPPSDLVAWWKLDDPTGSATVVDILGFNNALPKRFGLAAAVSVGAGANVIPVAGQIGGALGFMGGDTDHGYAEVASGPVVGVGDNPFTIDGWVRLPPRDDRLGPFTHHTLIGKMEDSTTRGYWLYLLASGPVASLVFQYNDGGGLNSAISPTFPRDTVWHFYAAVVDTSTSQVNFYRDGNLIGSSILMAGGGLATSEPLWLGFEPAIGGVSNHAPVFLDEIEVFSRPLGEDEIEQLYRHSVGRRAQGKCEPELGENEGTLCFRKFNDLNGNGVWDGGEPALFGFTFEIYDSNGNLVTTFTTSQQDNCLKLPAGTYTVKEVGPSGWTPTTPDPATVTINAGQATTLIVGNTQQPKEGTLCILKFEDTDGDGQQDPGENPLAGWQFEVYDSAGNLVTTVTTAGQQDVTCITLPEGTYTIKEVAQAGWVATTPDTQTVTISAGSSTTVAFGNQREQPKEGTLCVLKFEDLNGNGQQDAGENLLAGWQFEVYDSNGNLVTTITTGGQDFDCITLPVGDYTVKELAQAGWVPTTPQQQSVTISDGTTTQVKFGNQREQPQPGVLCVVKFEDADGDGQQGASEGLLGGWQFEVFDSGGNLVTTLTSSEQDASCTELPPGDYTVQEQVQQGWVVTTPNPQTVTVSSGSTTTVAFGNQQEQVPTGVLCVVKFEDLDGNGTQEAGENLLGGWQFDVFDSGGNLVGTLTSSEQDATCIELPPGDYTVQEEVQQGWNVTTPNPQTVTVSSGSTITVTFGNRQDQQQGSAQICVIKFNDADGDGQRGANDGLMDGWVFDIFDSGGNQVGTLTSSKQGPVCQEVSAPGTYTVEEQVQPGWTPTTPNPQTVTVNPGDMVTLEFGNKQG